MKRTVPFILIITLCLCGCKAKPAEVPQTIANCSTLAAAEYPETFPYPDEADYADNWDAYDKAMEAWSKAEYNKRQLVTDDSGNADYVKKLLSQLLNEGESNTVVSPANIYFALCMLAETTDGNSRTQVLEVLGRDNVEQLRENSQKLWQKMYKNDGMTTSVLANSMWLSDSLEYNADTVNILKDNYYASAFSGDFGDAAYSQALRDWINKETGGLLKSQADGLEFSPEMVFALASTVYYKSQWSDKFSEALTAPDTFHGVNGDKTVDFMNMSTSRIYYDTDSFSGTALHLADGASMYLLLPKNGYTVSDIVKDSECLDIIMGKSDGTKYSYPTVNLSVPKFDVDGKVSLVDSLKALGVTDVFDSSVSDFTPINTQVPIEVSEIEHAARVKIDEEGCEAAAYTVIMTDGASMPPDAVVDLKLDKPFLFAISGTDGLPRFVGTVNSL